MASKTQSKKSNSNRKASNSAQIKKKKTKSVSSSTTKKKTSSSNTIKKKNVSLLKKNNTNTQGNAKKTVKKTNKAPKKEVKLVDNKKVNKVSKKPKTSINKKKKNIKDYFSIEYLKILLNRFKISPMYVKILTVISIICIIILVVVGVLFLIHKSTVDRNNVYNDSYNGVIVDSGDVVVVGTSDFHYSKLKSEDGNARGRIIKYDDNGNVVFEKIYDKGISTSFNSIINVLDGYVVVGTGIFSKDEQENGGREALIIKYDKEGNVVWEKFYGVLTNTGFNKVIEISDGYLAVGQSIYANMELGNHTTGGGIIVKYDREGNEIWHGNHGGTKSGNFNDVVQVETDFYVVGKDGVDSGNLVKFNAKGEYQWHRNYSYTDSFGFSGIVYLNDSLYVVGSKKVLPEGTGDNDDRSTTNTDSLLIKYDLNGKILFEKTFGGSSYERYNDILSYQNNLYVVGHLCSKDAGLKLTTTDITKMTGLIIRYDINGNILKKEVFGGSNNDNLNNIVTDGISLYIVGYSSSYDGNIKISKNNGKDYFGKLIKLNSKFKTMYVR